jgi:hypothetical protein
MEPYMTELTWDEQQDVRGGDWFDAAVGYIEGLALVIGML